MIDIINLCKSFNGHRVLDNLNLTIKRGETIVVMGTSGCGKSVLLKHIIGLLQPESGQVLVDGTDITRLSPKALTEFRLKFGMLFQGAALFDSLTVEENVGFALTEHQTLSPSAIRQRVRECLALVGLRNIEEKYPAELSGGMRKRVGLARALAMRPRIILYDEPTTGLDPIMGDVINDLIRELRDKLQVTSIVVTHDMKSAFKVGDRLAMLYEGQIIAAGTPEEVKHTNNPVVEQFIQGRAEGPITDGLPLGRMRRR